MSGHFIWEQEMKVYRFFAVFMALALLTDCSAEPEQSASLDSSITSYSMATSSEESDSICFPIVEEEDGPEVLPCYFDELANKAIEQMDIADGDGQWDVVDKAYIYVITNTHYLEFDHPTLSSCWKYLDCCGESPSIYNAMAASPLQFGLGSCENYACALMLILDYLGLQTLYVPGLTYSVDGNLVAHAWVMVYIDENWYHIDPQLEDDVSWGMVTYRFFLKGDDEFAAHHVWGEALARPDARSLTLPKCPLSVEPPPPREITKPYRPSIEDALAQIYEWKDSGYASDLEPSGKLPPFPEDVILKKWRGPASS